MKRGKRQYGQWLKSATPKIPRGTAHRLQTQDDLDLEDNDEHHDTSRSYPDYSGQSSSELHQQAPHSNQNKGADMSLEFPPEDSMHRKESENEGNVAVDLHQHDFEEISASRVIEFEVFEGAYFDAEYGVTHDELQPPLDVESAQQSLPCGSSDNRQPTEDSPSSSTAPSTSEGSQHHKKKARKSLNSRLCSSVSTTVFECLLTCMNFSMRHGLTSVALGDLLKLINTIFGDEVVPESEFVFNEVFKGTFDVKFYFCCTYCGRLLGEKSSFKDLFVECDNCKKLTNVSSLCDNNFFVYIPIEQQLRHLFENSPDIFDLLSYRFNRSDQANDTISDVFDGSCYKSFAGPGGLLSDRRNFSVTLNTDGSPIFRSAKNTMYPVQFRINEIPPDIRFESCNCLVAAIWFGKSDPEMSAFLQPFVEDAKILYEKGFTWKNSLDGLVTSRIVTINCVLDSVAKPKVQKVMQFNAYDGCNYCEHPGVKIEEHPHPRYSMPNDFDVILKDNFESQYCVTRRNPKTHVEEVCNVKDRSNETMRQVMLDIQNDRVKVPVKGVNGFSPLFPLLFFDLVYGFVIDYMHAVLIGVCKLVTTLQLQVQSKGMPFFVGDQIHKLDERLIFIKPPSNISRRPRTMRDIGMWKANEWRAYLLYYSLPCLLGILPPQYLRHHCLLVSAIFILLKHSITREELKQAALYLKKYVCDFQNLYGEVNMNFNVHLVLHLCKCVEMFGPLWTFSAFCFESGNGCLVKLVKGTRFVAKQIAEKYVNYFCLPETVALYKVSDNIIDFCHKLFSFSCSKYSLRIGSTTVLGEFKRFKTSKEERSAFRLANISPQPFSFVKIIKDGIMFYASCHRSENVGVIDSAAKLHDGSYVYIERIVNVADNNSSKVYVLVRKLICRASASIVRHDYGASAAHIKICPLVVFGEELQAIPASELRTKVMFILDDGKHFKDSYLIEMLNHIEKD